MAPVHLRFLPPAKPPNARLGTSRTPELTCLGSAYISFDTSGELMRALLLNVRLKDSQPARWFRPGSAIELKKRGIYLKTRQFHI
jgi:hypothetical protein